MLKKWFSAKHGSIHAERPVKLADVGLTQTGNRQPFDRPVRWLEALLVFLLLPDLGRREGRRGHAP
jgi:hypothetical protein